ncbi:RluA family pseudouridine synthase [Haloferula chungangensis]|uniref:RluA family pseudouridine synthase n=1 Tax=Haloferula chungangensis TaxID=1048331 RepID=A0ABW2L8F6_9BACT
MNSPDTHLEIIHEDPDFVVVNKQSGMLSVPGRGPEKTDSVATRVKRLYPGCIEQPAVHRLDMDTSGLQLLALNADAHRTLSRQFEQRKTSKRYIALLDGILEANAGTIELPFRLDVDNRPIQIYDEVHGKIGITHWEKIGIENGRTRISFVPITGRTHQLRVHSAHPKGLGIPIVGDTFYGDGKKSGELRLHATELGFEHPRTGETLRFESSPGW